MSINELCNEGNSQSPININTENLKGCSSTCDIQFFYRNSKCKLLVQEIQSIIQKTKKNKLLTLEYDAGSYIRTLENRQGIKVGCPEETAFKLGLINKDNLKILSNELIKTSYGKYLQTLFENK